MDALGNTTANIYDSTTGLLLSSRDAIGTLTTNQYDAFGNITNSATTYVVSGTNVVLSTNSFTYDANGNRTSSTVWRVSNNVWTASTTLYVYDGQNRVTQTIDPDGTNFVFFDNAGRQSQTIDKLNHTNYQYDSLNRLTNVIDAKLSGQNTAYGYDSAGNLKWMQYPNTVTNAYQYDPVNRLTNMLWVKGGSTTNAFFAYQLGATGNRTNLSETISGAARTFSWQYDALYRLTNEAVNGTGPVGALAYTYDLVGNRLSRMGSLLATQAFTYDGNDRISGDFYDKDGNTTNHNSSVWTYDFEDRLLGNGSVSLLYNADGQVTKRVYNGTTTMYLVDALNPTGYPQILEEFTVSGTTNLAAAYTYGLSRISMRQPNVATNFYGFDGHGSTRFLLSTVGTVTESYVYDAYGVLISGGTVVSNNFWHCGEYHDAGLGLYDMRARHLNAGTGRFFTLDTFDGRNEDPLSLHKYAYCAENPVNRTDPSGHDFSAIEMTTGIGGLNAIASFRLALPSSGGPLGTGGPDVTETVKKTLQEVTDTFNHLWSPTQKARAQEEIQGPTAGNAWDIQQLQDVDARTHNYLALGHPNYDCGQGPWAGTVSFNNELYYAGAVNYALWGRIWRVCADYYGGGAFSLQRAKDKVSFFKHYMYGIDTAANEALAFTEYGYNGNLPMRGIPRGKPSGRTVTERLEWVWEPIHPRGGE